MTPRNEIRGQGFGIFRPESGTHQSHFRANDSQIWANFNGGLKSGPWGAKSFTFRINSTMPYEDDKDTNNPIIILTPSRVETDSSASSIQSSQSSTHNNSDCDPLPPLDDKKSEEIPKEPKRKHKKVRKQKFKLFTTSYFNHFFFVWINKLRSLGAQPNLLQNVILCLKNTETSFQAGKRLEEFWKLELKKPNPSLQCALKRTFGWQYLRLGVYKLVWIGFAWIGNFYALNYLLRFQENGNGDWMGYLCAILLGLSCLLASMAFHHLTISTSRVGIQCRAGLMVLVYRKSLKLSYVQGGVGEIVNLISVECNRMAEAFIDFHYLWSPVVECTSIF